MTQNEQILNLRNLIVEQFKNQDGIVIKKTMQLVIAEILHHVYGKDEKHYKDFLEGIVLYVRVLNDINKNEEEEKCVKMTK